jgi:hypothetical protein
VGLREASAILAAHSHGRRRVDRRSGKVQWEKGVIARKARLLKTGVARRADRRVLMEKGVVGRRWSYATQYRNGFYFADGLRDRDPWRLQCRLARRDGLEPEDVHLDRNSSGYYVRP